MGPCVAASSQAKERKAICIFESIGGTDKGPDGHRKDTIPILEEIKKKGWHCEVVKFENDKADQIYQEVVNKYSCTARSKLKKDIYEYISIQFWMHFCSNKI